MHNNKNPLISAIILSYNTRDITLRCLDSLKKSIEFLDKPVEIIVVENGNDGTANVIRKKYPWVKLIEPKENTGYARGNNLALKYVDSEAKYVLVLNSDVMVKSETLAKSIEFMEANSSCDVLGCRLVYGDGTFQPSGGFLPTPFSVFTWIMGIDLIPFTSKIFKPFHLKNSKNFYTRELDWVMGAYLFMKHEVVKKTKGLDENLFMYMEEVEWCKRIKDAGFKIYYSSDFSVTHLDKSSSKSDPQKLAKIAKDEILGVIYFLKKFYQSKYNLVLNFIKFGLYLRIFAFFIIQNKTRQKTYQEVLKSLV